MGQLIRRKLLVAALGGTAIPTLGRRSRALATTVNNQIQIALIGVRGMGFGHLRQLLSREDVRAAALCDINQKNLHGPMKR